MQNYILTLIGLILVTSVQAFNHKPDSPSPSGGPVVTVGAVSDESCDFNNINAAINSGSAEIRLTDMTFNEDIDLSNRNITLIGGYFNCKTAAIGGQSFSLTEISGTQSNPVISINNSNNSYSVTLKNLRLNNGHELAGSPGAGLRISGMNTFVEVDLMWVRLNQGSGIGIADNLNGQVNLKDIWIADNIAFDGGGIHCLNSNVQVYGASLIYSNEAIGSGIQATDEGKGGGAFIGTGCSFNYYSGPNQPQFGSNGIMWNLANHHGGGIYAEAGGDVYLYGQKQNNGIGNPDALGTVPVKLLNNTADADQNDTNTHGGAIYATGNQTVITINGVDVMGNSAPGYGGAVALFDQAQAEISRVQNQLCWSDNQCNRFFNNRAHTGGAVYAAGGSVAFLRNAWLQRNGAEFGSALFLSDADTVGFIDGTVVYDNDELTGTDTVKTVLHAVNGAELNVLFTTVVNNYAETSVLALFAAQMDLYGSLIFQDGNLPVAGQFNGSFFGECLYLYDDTEINGNNIHITSIDPFINRAVGDLHLNAQNEALDACAPNPQSSIYDMDNQLRGWDDPIPDINGQFDIGADESYFSDVIFYNDFESFINPTTMRTR